MLRKISVATLTALILLSAALMILSIWDIIDITNLLGRSLKTVMVVLGASGLLSIVFVMLHRDQGGNRPPSV